jgi:hypothetical protein
MADFLSISVLEPARVFAHKKSSCGRFLVERA